MSLLFSGWNTLLDYLEHQLLSYSVAISVKTPIFQTICNDCNNITPIFQFFKKLVVKKEPAHSFLPNPHLKPAFSSPIPLPSSEP